MLRVHRRYLALFFALLFVISASLTIFFAFGYRYNSAEQRIERTGSVVADSRPRGAQISIHGTATDKSTPAIINSISSGDVTVTLKKNGYHEWRKTLTVEPGNAALTGRVLLFKTSTPTVVGTLQGADQLTWSKDGNRLAYLVTDESGSALHVFDMIEASDKVMMRSVVSIESIVWHSRGDRLIVRTGAPDNSCMILDLRTGTYTTIASSDSNTQILQCAEDPQDSRRFMVLKKGGQESTFSSIDPDGGAGRVLLTRPHMITAHIVSNVIAYLEESDRGVRLHTVPLEGGEDRVRLLLSLEGSYEILGSPSPILAIRDANHNILSEIDLAHDDEAVRTIPDVSSVRWTQDGHIALDANEHEIWAEFSKTELSDPTRKYLAHEARELITRVSNPITQIEFSKPADAVLFAQDNSIEAMELDGRGGRMRSQLAQFPAPILTFILNAGGTTAYIAAHEGNAITIFQLDIT